MKKSFGSVLFLLFLALAVSSAGQDYFYEDYDVPYVPTRYEVVDKMLEMADVQKDDILYDLGCGDGRIVVTAAERYGTRGVGIDINPVRIEESMENANNAGVTDKVQFIEQNLFDADIREATVVTLYLLESVNLKLRPKLFRDLKPGTRIVSHNYSMGQWEPELSAKVDTAGIEHSVYFWVLPANVSGKWEWTLSSGSNNTQYILSIDQDFQVVIGTIYAGGIIIPIKHLAIDGDRLAIEVYQEINGTTELLEFSGSVNGDTIEGSVRSKSGTSSNTGTWKALRDPSTAIPLDTSDSESH